MVQSAFHTKIFLSFVTSVNREWQMTIYTVNYLRVNQPRVCTSIVRTVDSSFVDDEKSSACRIHSFCFTASRRAEPSAHACPFSTRTSRFDFASLARHVKALLHIIAKGGKRRFCVSRSMPSVCSREYPGRTPTMRVPR